MRVAGSEVRTSAAASLRTSYGASVKSVTGYAALPPPASNALQRARHWPPPGPPKPRDFWGFIFGGLMRSWVLADSPRFPGV